jgi:hypothetical protein
MNLKLKILGTFFKVFLLAIIPSSLIAYMVFKGISFEGVLAIIAYFQFLLIWAQAEIGLKQHVFFSAQFDPVFELTPKMLVDGGTGLTIKNTSKNPAYHVRVIRVLGESNLPINPLETRDKISRHAGKDLISYGSDFLTCEIKDIEFFEGKRVEILYNNQFGDFKKVFVFFSNGLPQLIPYPLEEPGILLKTLREIILLPSTIKTGLKTIDIEDTG